MAVRYPSAIVNVFQRSFAFSPGHVYTQIYHLTPCHIYTACLHIYVRLNTKRRTAEEHLVTARPTSAQRCTSDNWDRCTKVSMASVSRDNIFVYVANAFTDVMS